MQHLGTTSEHTAFQSVVTGAFLAPDIDIIGSTPS
jgi:hypothetical protein